MNAGERLAGRRVCICVGSGGVGKTTTAAALALGLARRGGRIAVVTIDPARRLAASLGLEALGNEPRRVDPALLTAGGGEIEGELWAMMLDVKRTFDDVIGRLAPDEPTREEILANRIYQQLSSAVAGSQEFTAIAKLYDLDREGGFDVIVLDTPPSRNALDFLDAPARLTQFFEGRALRLLLAPSGLAARLVGRGTGVIFAILSRVTGVDLLSEMRVFFRALSGLIDGFRERADSVGVLLRDAGTTFLIVTSPEREPSEEAIFFRAKLAEAEMPFGGLIVNRVHDDGLGGGDPAGAAEDLAPRLGRRLADRVAESLAERHVLAARDRRGVERLVREVGDPDPIVVPDLGTDVSDLEGLMTIERHLFGERSRGTLSRSNPPGPAS